MRPDFEDVKPYSCRENHRYDRGPWSFDVNLRIEDVLTEEGNTIA